MPVDPAAVSADRLRLFAPQSDYMIVAPALEAARLAHDISTPRRVRQFMAQLHVESGGFTRLVENLNYTHWTALNGAWPKRFPTEASCAGYLSNPMALANNVYAGRLGNTSIGDGYLYRGRGWIQITGRTNYGRATKWLADGVYPQGLVTLPDGAADPKVAAMIAAAFWQIEGLNEVADADAGEAITSAIEAGIRGGELDDLRAETQTINGGLNGWPARQTQLLRAASIWKD